ncbi:MAG: TlyA family rRNA (cytidine-2'-O)-methyltransferase [Myxococcota bacterium]
MPKKRLDMLLLERGLCDSRNRAQALIMSGSVAVDGIPATKPGAPVKEDAEIIIKETSPYVSRGGGKLKAAIDSFKISVIGKTCLDIGASTGGFCDCLLQEGAEKVFAVDVGYGQVAEKLRKDPRVIIMDKTNARFLTPSNFPLKFDLCVIDVSFISLTLIFPVLPPLMKKNSELIALIKPQFEAGRGKVGKGGVVKSEKTQNECIEKIRASLLQLGFNVIGIIPSPLKGAKKANQEFLIYAKLD